MKIYLKIRDLFDDEARWVRLEGATSDLVIVSEKPHIETFAVHHLQIIDEVIDENPYEPNR